MRQVWAWCFLGIAKRKVWLQFQKEKTVGEIVNGLPGEINLLGHEKKFSSISKNCDLVSGSVVEDRNMIVTKVFSGLIY